MCMKRQTVNGSPPILGVSAVASVPSMARPVNLVHSQFESRDSDNNLSTSASKRKLKEEEVDSDEEDNKPLISKLKAGSAYPANADKVDRSATKAETMKEISEESDDEAVISSKFGAFASSKSAVDKSVHDYDSEEDNKPLASKLAKQKPQLKRPLDKDAAAGTEQSSAKKLKNTKSGTLSNTKQASISDEKNKQPAASAATALSAKKKLEKVTSSNKKVVVKGKDNNKKKMLSNKKKSGKDSEYSKSTKLSPCSGDGQKKWTTLIHNGVIFPPPYKPHGVKMLYKKKPVYLTPEQEEVATMYAVMLDTDYMQKPRFKENFWNDWRKILGKNHVIQNLDDCDFRPIYDWYQQEKEKKKQMTTEEKKILKEEKTKHEEKYMWAIVDGVKEKVGNFRVEPPGLFRGRGDHPKMGKLKKRIHPWDITINIGRDAPVPECPIPGERWKEVRHDDTVTWLAFWNDPINPKLFKYVFLAASSSLKGQSDKEKYEKARMLKDYIENIRAAYRKDFTSKDITKQQIAVATYLIDKLALRAGNEKDDEEAADTVGCCTLKVENVEPRPPDSLHFDFLGKDSIRYEKDHTVDVLVYGAIVKFRKGKRPSEPLFDKLDTSKLNAHLKELMPGLTAKVFRTYNASITLDNMLNEKTINGDAAEKINVYQHANKEVAIICNHQRTISKSHAAQMSKLSEKIEELESVLKELKTDFDRAKKGKPPSKSADGKSKKSLTPEVLDKKITQTVGKIEKMKKNKEIKEDLKEIALGTSKINYLDPRITVAWCKRQDVPIEKIFNKSLLAKFAWAMDVDPDFRF